MNIDNITDCIMGVRTTRYQYYKEKKKQLHDTNIKDYNLKGVRTTHYSIDRSVNTLSWIIMVCIAGVRTTHYQNNLKKKIY